MAKQDRPKSITFAAGEKAFFCQCGKSQTFPYCDGTHKGTGQKPMVVTFSEECKKSICHCGKSADFPYCDGSHKILD